MIFLLTDKFCVNTVHLMLRFNVSYFTVLPTPIECVGSTVHHDGTTGVEMEQYWRGTTKVVSCGSFAWWKRNSDRYSTYRLCILVLPIQPHRSTFFLKAATRRENLAFMIYLLLLLLFI